MEPVTSLLVKIIQDDRLHARFLNNLSYLEYRGARKIARALNTEDVDEDVLKHAMEEAKHALFFKKLAIRFGGNEFKFYRKDTLLAETAIKRYFYELDYETERLLLLAPELKASVKKATYHFVTWLIEVRAISIYREYEKLLGQYGRSISLKPILSEEALHLSDVNTQIEQMKETYGIEISPLVALEDRLFWETWTELRGSIAPIANNCRMEAQA